MEKLVEHQFSEVKLTVDDVCDPSQVCPSWAQSCLSWWCTLAVFPLKTSSTLPEAQPVTCRLSLRARPSGSLRTQVMCKYSKASGEDSYTVQIYTSRQSSTSLCSLSQFDKSCLFLQGCILYDTTVTSSAGSTPQVNVSNHPTTTRRTCGMQVVRLVRICLVLLRERTVNYDPISQT